MEEIYNFFANNGKIKHLFRNKGKCATCIIGEGEWTPGERKWTVDLELIHGLHFSLMNIIFLKSAKISNFVQQLPQEMLP